MTTDTAVPPLRLERALRLLPDVDAIGPLRAFLLSTSRGRGTAEPYGTLDKRYVQAADVRELVPQALKRVSEHLSPLYRAAVDALDAEQRGDFPAAARALLRAGELEEQVGRHSQAYAWYDHAHRVAQELRDRRPEIESLRHLGQLEVQRGHLEQAGRFSQRSLALAEGEFDYTSAALACQTLAEIALAQGRWQGAESWYTRGLRYGEHDPALTGSLYLGLGAVARHQERLDVAEDWLRRAREVFQDAEHASGMARLLDEWGQLQALHARHGDALASYREALAQLRRAGGNPRLEVAIRLHIAHLYFDWGRIPDAEDEVRRGEEAAIAHNLSGTLARLYILMGKMRARQADDRGFVFFEKALELSRGREPSPRLEAESYLEYALFRRELGDREEARAYLERSRDILETLGGTSQLARVDAELAKT